MNDPALQIDEPNEGKKTRNSEPGHFLHPTYFINFEHPEVRAFAELKTDGARGDVEKAVALFYAVRDGIRYNPYELKIEPKAYRASYTCSIPGWSRTVHSNANCTGVIPKPANSSVKIETAICWARRIRWPGMR